MTVEYTCERHGKELCLQEPEIIEIGMRVRVTIFLAKPHKLAASSNDKAHGGANEGVKSLLFLSYKKHQEKGPLTLHNQWILL